MTTVLVAIIFSFATWVLGEARGYNRGVRETLARKIKEKVVQKIIHSTSEFGHCFPRAE